MNRLETFLTGSAIAVAAALTTGVHVVEENLGLAFGPRLVADAVVIALAFTFIRELIAVTLLEASALRRAILRGTYIEGTWVDVVSYPDREPLIGVVHLSSHGTGLKYYGENFYPDGTHANQFATQGVQVEFPRLTFHYTAGGAGEEGPFLGGVGLIAFDGRGPRGPGRYTGYCLDAAEGTRHKLIGARVEDPTDLIELADPNTRVEAALRLAVPLINQLGGQAAPRAE